ncbi:MAG: cation-translocating P-type ATPase [Acidobacteria bacterium]|nr:cation-translocating P-type ATPase [Acidobacteriota bacterium]
MPDRERRGALRAAVGVLTEPMLLVLLAAGAVNMAVNDPVDGAMLLSTAVLVTLVALVQEGRAERALDRLRELASPPATVVRDGRRRTVPSREVVLGDLLVVSEGNRIAADGGVVASEGLAVDEALLTGESLPVEKDPGSQVAAGTLVVRGSGAVVVSACGARTELGRIGAAISGRVAPAHALRRDVRRVVGWMGLVAIVVAVAVSAAIWSSRDDALQGVLAGLAVAMSMIPEELPVVLTVFLALGAWRMAKSRVIVRVPHAIESLGAVTVLCADKTGTMTRNDMEVASVTAGLRAVPLDRALHPSGVAGWAVLETARLAIPGHSQDPMDAAVVRLTGVAGQWPSSGAVVRDYPFGGSMRVVARARRTGADGGTIAAKGAPEDVAALCGMDAPSRHGLAALVDRCAESGQRVIAVATAPFVGEPPDRLVDVPWAFNGTIGFADPVRESAATGIVELARAGVRTVMVTGDHPATAASVAAAVGIDGRVVTGRDLDAVDDDHLVEVVRGAAVFARVTPVQKVRLVAALQADGEVVAMTGDGVNDAPALHAADVGIAFGSRGSDVAREAADLVVTGDDLGAIASGVHLGREIFVNLRRAATFVVAVHVPIAGIALLPALSGAWPIVLLPTQVALLELVIDPACAVVLESERSSRESLRHAPRRAGESLVSRRTVVDGLARGAVVLAAASVCYAAMVAQGASAEEVRTAVFVLLMSANLGLVATVGPRDGRTHWTARRALRWIVGASVGVVASLLSVPVLRDALGFALVHAMVLAGSILAGLGASVLGVRRWSAGGR